MACALWTTSTPPLIALQLRPAEAGKFPLRDAYLAGRAQPLQDRGFTGSQEAALPDLWFEAGAARGGAPPHALRPLSLRFFLWHAAVCCRLRLRLRHAP